MSRCWEFELDLKSKKIKTFVYSDTGTDIEQRFTKEYKVSNIKEIAKSLTADLKLINR